ncbi:MAG: hypothetical protein ACNA71_04440 [Kiritimatiellia bacterium]
MKHEVKKVMKIADEVMTVCMYKYEPETSYFAAERSENGYDLIFRFRGVALRDEDVAYLRDRLSADRNPELEDYYWQLAGEVENSNELYLVALMTDLAEVSYDGDALLIHLVRKQDPV